MKSGIIFVDESGNTGLKSKIHNSKHPFFVLGFCYCSNPKIINRRLRKLLIKLQKKKIHPLELKEFKFYPTPALKKLGYTDQEIQNDWEKYYPRVRCEVAKLICKYADGVYAGILDKRTIRQSTWTSETIGNFVFKFSLLGNILPELNLSCLPSIIYDRGRLTTTQSKLFNQSMLNMDSFLLNYNSKQYGRNLLDVSDTDSLKTPGIWLGDFVAGAFHHKFKYDDSTYHDLLKPKFIGDGLSKLWF